jgi:geranyl-CoA carboxylase beta subunit
VRCMVVASDSGIDAGAIQHMGREKLLRAQELALTNKLPFVHLVESAGANLLRYRVEGFIHGGAIFHNLAKLSAAGIPVITVVHGSSTAGGAYMPGLSDYVIMVRSRAKAFLAGPPLLKAATGEIAIDEELGGAVMHTHVSGLGEYLAEDDADGVRLARDVIARLNFGAAPVPGRARPAKPPRHAAEELLGIISDHRKPVDMREVIARFADDSDFLDFKPDYGPATVCGHAAVQGFSVGIVTNNGPLDPDGATKATHFIQACCQAGLPILYL